ncbi:MAG: membrane protein insertion efficiency factor YidD [Leptospirillum sp.]|uniref:Putative membrane protein insertion efficiency factor n=1 Tax=Leptospirillum ferriphilum TaxID=178606 RepID=A0A7C3QWH0_9BACT
MGNPVASLVRSYQRWISPFLPPSCRFTPTCSEYVRISFLNYPVHQAFFRSVKRILKCHPFHPGGFDPP